MDGSALHPMASTTFLVWLAERSGGSTSFVTFAPYFASPSPRIAFNAAISASLSPIPSAPASAVRSRDSRDSPCFRIYPRGRDEPPNDRDWQDAHANAADAILTATSGPHPGRSNERMVHVRSFRMSINASTIAGEASVRRNEVRPASPMRSGQHPRLRCGDWMPRSFKKRRGRTELLNDCLHAAGWSDRDSSRSEPGRGRALAQCDDASTRSDRRGNLSLASGVTIRGCVDHDGSRTTWPGPEPRRRRRDEWTRGTRGNRAPSRAPRLRPQPPATRTRKP